MPAAFSGVCQIAFGLPFLTPSKERGPGTKCAFWVEGGRWFIQVPFAASLPLDQNGF